MFQELGPNISEALFHASNTGNNIRELLQKDWSVGNTKFYLCRADPHSPKHNLIFCIKTEPGAFATVPTYSDVDSE